jgi:succinate dehydrogenase (ubiquinone) cytochrome b560 subunit
LSKIKNNKILEKIFLGGASTQIRMRTMSLTLMNLTKKAGLQLVVKRQSLRSMSIISKESAEEYKKLNYTSRQKQTGRPVSPHVSIYAFPIGALSSITNRVTGCALSVGCAGLGVAELVGGSGTALSLVQTVGSQGILITAAAKFSVSFPIIYHYLGAIRHTAWDMKPEMLTNVDVEKASYVLFGSSVAISGGLMFF